MSRYFNKGEKRASSKDYDTDYLYRVCGGGKDYLKNSFNPRFYEAVKIAHITPKDTVLDIGGGRGEVAFLSAKIGAHTTVIDYSQSAINIIKKHAQAPSFKKLNIGMRVMNAKKMSFRDGTFDKIFLLEVIEHLTDSEINQVFKEMLRVLKQNGTLIVSTGPNRLMIKPLLFAARLFFPKMEWESRKYHINEQSYWSLKRLFERHNLAYTIQLNEAPHWFYDQIVDNSSVSNAVKGVANLANRFYDFWVFRKIRSLPLLNKIFCHGFLVKLERK